MQFNPVSSVQFVYTQKCNAHCSHCINNCGPEETAKLNPKKVIDSVNEISELKIKDLGITGGESLIFLDEITAILSAAKKKKIRASMVSNAFWASDEKKAKEIALSLDKAGLKELDISCDSFHIQFIPFSNIINAFNALENYTSIKPCLRFTLSKSKSLEAFILKFKDYFLNKKGNKLKIFVQELLPFGRAQTGIPKSEFNSKKQINKNKCVFLGNPTVNSDNRSFICCNGFDVESNAFVLGDFNKSSLTEIVNSYKKSLFVFYLRHKGPYFISKLAEKHNLEKKFSTSHLKLLDKYIGLCDYCVLNLGQYSREDLTAMLEKELSKDKKMQKLAKKDALKKKKK